MFYLSSRQIDKQAKAQYKWLFTIIVLIAFVTLSLSAVFIDSFSYVKNMLLLHLNSYKWNQLTHTQFENIGLGYDTCFLGSWIEIDGMTNDQDNSLMCQIGLSTIDIEQGFQIALDCINTFQCNVEYDPQYVTPMQIHFQETDRILMLKPRELLIITPSDN